MSDPQSMHSGVGLAIGVAAGLAGGWLFYRVWRWIMPEAQSHQFWQRMPESMRGMVRSEQADDVLRHYRELLACLARFGGRNVLAVAAGLVPVALAFLLVDSLGLPERLTPGVNPFDQWLSDLELWFFLAVMAGSAIAAWSARRRRWAA